MHKPPSVSIVLGPSRIALVGIAFLAVATIALLFAMTIPLICSLAAASLVATWAVERSWVIGLRRGRRSVTALRVDGNDATTVQYASGESSSGALRTSSRVGGCYVALVWRPSGAFLSRSILILPDMLPRDEFRRLRVLMRYGRSDSSHLLPASHA